jgi:Fe-Mn family superoxide dismutase
MRTDRRLFLKGAATFGIAAFAGTPILRAAQSAGFDLAKLPYGFDALEPVIDAKTMEIHWGRHHKAYVDNLNKALAGKNDWLSKPVDQILKEIESVPSTIRQAVINNGGGHSNHSHFWNMMKAGGSEGPSGNLKEAIDSTFGSLDKLKELMGQNGLTRFGSGWTWLVKGSDGKLAAYSTANQDSPLMKGHTPILGIDVWEHAYYLKYQNKRADYLAAWWKVANWKRAEELFA